MTFDSNTPDFQDFTVEGDWVKDIYDMHTKFGVREVIKSLPKDKLLQFISFRLKFLQEELDEAYAAFDVLTNETDSTQLVTAADDLVDSMIDLCVVSIGTLDALEVDSYEAWARVRDANMAKNAGVNPNRPNPLGLPDLIKPAGWTAPQHADNIGLLKTIGE